MSRNTTFGAESHFCSRILPYISNKSVKIVLRSTVPLQAGKMCNLFMDLLQYMYKLTFQIITLLRTYGEYQGYISLPHIYVHNGKSSLEPLTEQQSNSQFKIPQNLLYWIK